MQSNNKNHCGGALLAIEQERLEILPGQDEDN
jgi:hypothetical protein